MKFQYIQSSNRNPPTTRKTAGSTCNTSTVTPLIFASVPSMAFVSEQGLMDALMVCGLCHFVSSFVSAQGPTEALMFHSLGVVFSSCLSISSFRDFIVLAFLAINFSLFFLWPAWLILFVALCFSFIFFSFVWPAWLILFWFFFTSFCEVYSFILTNS